MKEAGVIALSTKSLDSGSTLERVVESLASYLVKRGLGRQGSTGNSG